jgi:imidazolonepropionase-like amidohydrolase
MVRVLLSLCLILLSSSALAGEAAVTVYRNVTVIDGLGGPPRPGQDLLIQGERILAIRPTGQPVPEGARVETGQGRYVLPGLIDSHEHLATPPNRPFAEAQMRRDLYGGVTSVRDMADDLRQVADLARAARIGEIAGPDIHYAALMAGPSFFEDPRTHAVTQGAVAGKAAWMQSIDETTDLPMAIALARGTGATAIKIYANLLAERVAAITAEAHRQGLAVWAHGAVFPASPSEVLSAGVDVVSHVCMLAYEGADPMPQAYHRRAGVDEKRFPKANSPIVAPLLARMAREGTILDATLRIYDAMDRRAAAHPEAPQGYCSGDLGARLTAQARKAGVMISTGTDGFAEPEAAWPSVFEEMDLLVTRAGFTPMQAITAATRIGALSIARDPDFGTLEPGKLANLVFVAEDPSRDLKALETMTLVVKRGRAYPRSDYDPARDLAARQEP